MNDASPQKAPQKERDRTLKQLDPETQKNVNYSVFFQEFSITENRGTGDPHETESSLQEIDMKGLYDKISSINIKSSIIITT